jgi:hypothetical protein
MRTSKAIALALLLVMVAVACTDDDSNGAPGATDGDGATDQQSMTWLVDRLPVMDDPRVDIVAGPLDLPVGESAESSVVTSSAIGFDSFGSAPADKWQRELGVDPAAVTWAVTLGSPPENTIVLTGDIDSEAVIAALESTINPVETSQADGWDEAVIPGPELEPELAESTYLNSLGRALRYATKNGVVIVSTTDDGRAMAKAAFDAEGPTLGDDPAWVELAERADQSQARGLAASAGSMWAMLGLTPDLAGIVTADGATADILIFSTAEDARAAADEINRWIELASASEGADGVTIGDQTPAEIAQATRVLADRSSVIVSTTSAYIERAPGLLLPTLFCAAEPAAEVCAGQPPG